MKYKVLIETDDESIALNISKHASYTGAENIIMQECTEEARDNLVSSIGAFGMYGLKDKMKDAERSLRLLEL